MKTQELVLMPDIAATWMWVSFSVFVAIAIIIDTLFVARKTARGTYSIRTALIWSVIWIACAGIFNLLLWLYLLEVLPAYQAKVIALNFLAGFIIEKTLSIDNLFVFYLIFDQFRIPQMYQQRVFSYGIWSAVVFRLGIILVGTWLVTNFHWILYVMGIFLLLTGIKMMFAADKTEKLRENWFYGWLKKHLRITNELHKEHFFVRLPKLHATPLFIVLIFIEISDLIFAMDSIPAIFGITTDPFIVWTSNMFAILGLRAMYFLLAGMVEQFHLLKYGVAIILMFVGLKMVLEPWIVISIGASLGFIIGVLVIFTWFSIKYRKKIIK